MSTSLNDFDLESREAKLLFLLERDFPNMKDEIKEIKSKVENLDDKVSNLKDSLSKDLEVKFTFLNKREELPFYKDFQKILILLFAVGFMILSGVKAYENLAHSIFPQVTISESHSTNGSTTNQPTDAP